MLRRSRDYSAVAGDEDGDFEDGQQNFSLNQTEKVLLNLGVSTLLDKGSEAIGDKITGSKGDPFTDKMTYEEAARYNEYWNSLENGVHDNVQNGFQGVIK